MSAQRPLDRSPAGDGRPQAGLYLGLGVLCAGTATISWLRDDLSRRRGRAFSVLAVGHLGLAAVLWRRARPVRDQPPPAGVELQAVDETVLARLVGAALSSAEPDEVTPPVTATGRWGPERIEWLRRFHRDRRPGLDGPLGEATWAVTSDQEVVGAVRLKRTAEPDVLETGIWLVREVRGKGVGRQAVALVLAKAQELGAAAVRADTSQENAAALLVLQRLGFETSTEGDRVAAVRRFD
jgi:RimJ/RimL family protein N-acetyltransferase